MTFSPQHLDRLRLRHLRLLELIDRHRSLRAVGAVFNLTQPAVSQMVKDLEFALGATLVERSPRGVELSRAGQLALQRARSGLATLDHMASELQADLSPVLRLGTNPALLSRMLPEALKRLQAADAGLRFRMRTGMAGEMMQALWNGDLDCYVGRVDWDRLPQSMAAILRLQPLAQTELMLACAPRHPLARRKTVRAHDLVGWDWALPAQESNNRVALETGLRNHGLPAPSPVVEIPADPHALMTLARELDLLICVPRLVLDAHVAAGDLVALDVQDLPLPPIQLGFVTLAEHQDMTAVTRLRQALVDVCQPEREPA